MDEIQVFFASPRRLPDPTTLPGRVVVLDIAFAADGGGGVSYATVTEAFLQGLGARLAAWVDHHDHPRQADFAGDERFVLASKQEAGACPEMITPELVRRTGPVQSILAHHDLDGLYAAAKWIREGRPPYPTADADARAVDTREGTPSARGALLDHALRARTRDQAFLHRVRRFLVAGCPSSGTDLEEIRAAATEFDALAARTQALARTYRVEGPVARVKVPVGGGAIDKTDLLLLGQALAPVAVVEHSGMITVAAAFGSGYDFPRLLGLSGGMPTRVSAPADRLPRLLAALGVRPRKA
jgi:hypothetical protein